MTVLKVEGLVKEFGSVRAVDDVSFEVEPGEFLSLLGPSGCGKTTTLRCIAGFEQPTRGRILIDDEPLTDMENGIFVPPNLRNFGMVFQSYAVWPHMTVMENVAYPLQVKGGMKKPDIEARVLDKLALVGLGGLEKRLPTQLSGGQQQRVALARALVMEPRVLLFDEPLSNLDAKLREHMRFELMELQSQVGIPAVYVTHDQAEAMVISRRILVMEGGQIAQMGRPKDIYQRPATRFVADFIGLTNFVPGKIKAQAGEESWTVSCGFGDARCMSAQQHSADDTVSVAIRPERMQLSIEPLDGENVFEGALRNAYFLGPYSEYFVDIDDVTLRVQCSFPIAAEPGQRVYVQAAPEDCLVLTGASEDKSES
jgi:iron(III) transport system ATP-binding protein